MNRVIASDVALEPGREAAQVRRLRLRPGAARRSQIAWGYLLLLPAVVFLAVLIVEPFAKAVQYSLESWDGIGPARRAGRWLSGRGPPPPFRGGGTPVISPPGVR